MKKARLFGSNPAAPPQLSQPQQQPHSSTRPKSGYQSVRGRISSPIPIPNPLDDEEFPIRNPGTGIASSTPIDESHKQPPSLLLLPPPLPPPPPPPAVAVLVAQTFPPAGRTEILDVPQTVPEHPSTPTQRQRHDSAAGLSNSSPDGALSSVSASRVPGTGTTTTTTVPSSAAARYSTMSSHSAKTASTGSGGGAGQNSPPRRKKSTLRSAIHKLLRRRRKEGSLSSVSESGRPVGEEGQQQQNLHRSVPPATRVAADPNGFQPKRVTSMPISEFDRALRSHSVGPEDMTVIGSVRNSIDALNSPRFVEFQQQQQQQQLQFQQHQGRIYSGIIQPRSRGEEWGLSPRPASVHHHHSLQHHSDHDDPDAIGRAITSDSSTGGDMGHKRRSRSLSQLDEVALEQFGNGRRRSDEIRYWRQSYDMQPGPLSPLSSNPEEDRLQETTDAVDMAHVGSQEAAAADHLAARGNTAAAAPATVAVQEGSEEETQARRGATTESPAERLPNTPLQPFNFGPVAVMSEMAGMKITQAVTLEERFTFLEARMNKLERIVNQLCHSVPGFKGPFVDLSMAQQQQQQQQQQTAASTPSVAAPSTPFHPSTTSTNQPPTSAIQRVPTQRVHVNQPTYAYSTALRPMIPSIYQSDPAEENAAGYDQTRIGDGDASSSRYTVEHDGQGDDDDNTSSRMSFADANTYYLDSLHPPSSSATQAVSTTATSAPGMPSSNNTFLPGLYLRPTSDVTVRPANSMPSLLSGSQSSHGGGAVIGCAVGDERGDARSQRSSNTAVLVTQLDAERAARHVLEEQVRKLSERLNTLSTTMFAMVRDPGNKGTTTVGGAKSSEEGTQQQQAAVLDNKSQTQLPGSMINIAAIPRTAITTETALPSNKPTPSLNTSAIAPSSKAQSIFGRHASASGSGIDSLANSPVITRRETGDESILLPSPSEEGPFQTPRELPPTPAGVFGDEFGAAAAEHDSYVYGDEEDGDDDEEDGEEGKARRKVASRVLSLSQLTMGTGLPTRI